MSDAASTRDWLFCPITGALMDLKPEAGIMTSRGSKFVRHLDDIADFQTKIHCNMESYRWRYKLEPLVKDSSEEEVDPAQIASVRATTEESCPKCGHQGLQYHTMQLRSADEGQTVFYDCPKCKHKFSQNT